jgi:hypothetical protein
LISKRIELYQSVRVGKVSVAEFRYTIPDHAGICFSASKGLVKTVERREILAKGTQDLCHRIKIVAAPGKTITERTPCRTRRSIATGGRIYKDSAIVYAQPPRRPPRPPESRPTDENE